MKYRHLVLGLVVSLSSGCLRLGPDGSSDPAPTPVGFPIGMPVTATIGPSGGVLASGDGAVTLTVPAGALAAPLELSVVRTMNFAHGGIGGAYELGPAGTTFATPATITFAVDEAALVRSDAAGVGIATQSSEGLWHWSDATYDGTAHTIATTTGHLSPWSLVEGVQLLPGGAVVPEGASIGISVVSCYSPPSTGSDPLTPLGYTCDTAGPAPLVQVDEWAVNGTAGGDGTHGTITGSGLEATYHAPGTAPNPPTVRVSARVRGGPYGGVAYVFSNLAIGQPHPLAGTVTVRQPQSGIDFAVTLDVTMPIADDGPDETNWSATGTARLSPTEFTMGDANCVADAPTQAVDESYFLKIRKDPMLAVRFGSITGWNFTCRNAAGMSFPWFVSVSGQTGRELGCIVPDDVPITDVGHVDATYAATCSPIGPAEITWSLHRTD